MKPLLFILAFALLAVSPAASHATAPAKPPLDDKAFHAIYKILVAHVEEHRHEEALALAKELETLARDASDLNWVATALWRQAQYHRGRGETEEALRLFTEVRDIHSQLVQQGRRPNTASQISLLGNFQSIYITQGKLGKAYLAHRETEEALRAMYRRDGHGEIENLYDPNGPHFALRTFPSALGYLLQGETYFRENGGDIDGALEIARLAVRHFEQAERVTEWEENAKASAYHDLADLLIATGQTGEALDVLDILASKRTTYRAAQHFLSAQIDRAHLQLLAGHEPEPLFDTVRAALEESEQRRDIGRALVEHGTLARMHAHLGNVDEALSILENAVARVRIRDEKTNLARLLVIRAEILLADSQYDRVEADLEEALGYFRAHGLLRDEVAAFAIFGQYLAETGQLHRAPAFLTTAEFLADRFRGTLDAARLQEALTTLRQTSKSTATLAPKNTGADLQPVTMTTRVAPGELARGRFLLINPGTKTVSGTLIVSGSVAADAWNADRKIWAVAIESHAVRKNATRNFTLEPGDKVTIFTESASATPSAQTVEFRWSGPPEMFAWWHFSHGETAAEATVVNANLAIESPFYSVPLYHEIYYRGPQTRHRQNFRIKTSAPSRIVIANETTGQILAIDAQADGDFQKSGDVLFHDADENGFPDLPMDAETGVAFLEILVFPLQTPVSEDSLSVEIDLLNADGQWEKQEKNILIRAAP